MSYTDTAKEQGCNSLHAVVDASSGKFVCFSRVDNDLLLLCASDGVDVWRRELSEQSVESYKEISGLNTEAFFIKFRQSFKKNEIHINQDAGKLSLSLGKGVKSIEFDLYETTAKLKRIELQTILFRLAEAAVTLQDKLDIADTRIDSLNQKQQGGPGGSALDMGDSKKKLAPKVVPKKTGMSVINPGTRKRKAARGVEFD